MSEYIIVTIITGIVTVATTIITVLSANNKSRLLFERELQYQQTQIEKLEKSVKEHNNYAKEIPLINERIENLKENVTHIRTKVEKE